jgi:RNA polymerase sigma-70 factor (ECF subfamily)
MNEHPGTREGQDFSAVRPKLFSIAYRMLGTRADAEDVVRDAWLRWQGTQQSAVQSAEAWRTGLAAPRRRQNRIGTVLCHP